LLSINPKSKRTRQRNLGFMVVGMRIIGFL
jgi:hypothetical protein